MTPTHKEILRKEFLKTLETEGIKITTKDNRYEHYLFDWFMSKRDAELKGLLEVVEGMKKDDVIPVTRKLSRKSSKQLQYESFNLALSAVASKIRGMI